MSTWLAQIPAYSSDGKPTTVIIELCADKNLHVFVKNKYTEMIWAFDTFLEAREKAMAIAKDSEKYKMSCLARFQLIPTANGYKVVDSRG